MAYDAWADLEKSSGGGFSPWDDDLTSTYIRLKFRQEKAQAREMKRRKKKVLQLRKKVDSSLDKGLSWERIAKQNKLPLKEVKAYSQATRPEYGIKPLLDPEETITRAFISPELDVNNIQGKVLRTQTRKVDNARIEFGDNFLANIGEDILNAPRTLAEGGERIGRGDVKGGIFQMLKGGLDAASILPVGKVISVASKATAGKSILKEAVKQNAIQGAKIGGGFGAAYGAADAGSQGGSTRDIFKSALMGGAVGGVAGGVIGGATGGLSARMRPTPIEPTPSPITDSARLLQEGGSMERARLAQIEERLNEIKLGKVNNSEFAPEPKSVATGNLGDTVQQVPGGTLATQRGSMKSTGEAKALMAERKKLHAQLDAQGQGDKDLIKQLSDVDEQIVKAHKGSRVTPEKAAELAAHRQAIVANLSTSGQKETKRTVQAVTDVTRTAMNASTDTPTLAKKTEARAIAKGLSEGFDDMPVKVQDSYIQQVQVAQDLANSDYSRAVSIALGEEGTPTGMLQGAFYKAVETKALLKGDDETLRRLATESDFIDKTVQAGKEIGILGVRDPNSPVDAIKEINTLREAAKAGGVKDLPEKLSVDEMNKIIEMARVAETKKNAWIDTGMTNLDDPKRLDYGRAQIAFYNHINALKQSASKKTLKERFTNQEGLRDEVMKATGNTKSLRSSMDNSALLRQGWKALMTNPVLWQRRARQSFSNIVKSFSGKEVLDETAADIVSRPNNLNGQYKAMKLAVGVDEEAYPEHLGYKIPLIGRAYKASEASFVSFIQTLRADIADKYIQIATHTGVDVADPKEMKAIGRMVNGLTSRGTLKHEGAAQMLNNVFFSPRLMKSHVEVLGGHVITGAGGSNFVRKQAAINLAKIVSGTATILAIANTVKPGSVEWDPRSSNFGKIRIGNTRFDVSGGMSSVITLASRMVNGHKKSSTTGDVTKLEPGFGKFTQADVIIDFFENKLSPVGAVIADHWRGEDFHGNKPTIKSDLLNLTVPLIIANNARSSEPGGANRLMSLIAETLGVSANTYSSSPTSSWKSRTSQEMKDFYKDIGQEKFTKAYDEFNLRYDEWFRRRSATAGYKRASNKERKKIRTQKADEIKYDIFDKYGFEY